MKILLIEDESEQRQLIVSILKGEGFNVTDVSDAEQALIQLSKSTRPFDLIISDWQLPGMSGEELLIEIKKNNIKSHFILITAHSDAAHAVKIIKAGADDYIPKPFDKSNLIFTIKKLFSHSKSEAQELKSTENSSNDATNRIIGQSKVMQKLFGRIDKAAPTKATILITGESGTGKELVASAIHQSSTRATQKLLIVNCGAIPEGLAETELFGSEKGAFTGATSARLGKFEAANEGTIFLDEVGELPLNLQTKLLRFLQEGTITRVGSNSEKMLNVRVLAATHRDLQEEVSAGRFREDLYYRLNVIPIKVPALRERENDVELLIKYYLNFFIAEHQLGDLRFDQQAFNFLERYTWPGNVRQLKNSIERLSLLAFDNLITLDDVKELELPDKTYKTDFQLPSSGLDWESHEKDCLVQALSQCNNNKTKAAQLLGLPYKAFLYRLDKHNI